MVSASLLSPESRDGEMRSPRSFDRADTQPASRLVWLLADEALILAVGYR
jgi:hypothetical protein